VASRNGATISQIIRRIQAIIHFVLTTILRMLLIRGALERPKQNLPYRSTDSRFRNKNAETRQMSPT